MSLSAPFTILAARFWPDQHGGVETRLWHMARSLAQRGVEVAVFTENRSGLRECQTLAPTLNVRRFPPMDPGRLWRWRTLVRIGWWREHLRTHLPATGWIWASDPFSALAVVMLGQRHRMVYNPAACVAGMRHIGRLYPHITTMRPPRAERWADQLAYRLARRTIVSSHNLARQYARFYKGRTAAQRIQVLPLAARTAPRPIDRDMARASWELPTDGLTLGFVGRLDPCKGLDDVLEAMAARPLRPNTRLLIIGDGPDEARLRDIAMRLGLNRHVIFAGRMNDPTPAYAAMDALVMPSVYEAFGLAAVEAMAAGVPVVARRGNDADVLTAFDEIIDHGRTGWLFDHRDGTRLVDILATLEAAPQQCRIIGRDAQRTTGERDWDCYVQQCIALLSDHHSLPQPDRDASPPLSQAA